MSQIVDCYYTDPPHTHEYPDDWNLGRGVEPDPRHDPRWSSTVYIYYNADATEAWRTVVPLCDDQALDEFTKVAQIKGSNPKWCWAKRPGGQIDVLPWEYNKEADTLFPTGGTDA